MIHKIYPIHSHACNFSKSACSYFLDCLPSKFEVANEPESSDLNLVFNRYDDKIVQELPKNILYSVKTAIYSEGAVVQPVLPGVYVNLTHQKHIPGKTCSGGYISYLAENGGNPFCRNSEKRRKRYLFSHVGRQSYTVRRRLQELFHDFPGACIKDTSESYNHWSPDPPEQLQRIYAETIAESHFSLCPRGKNANSIRLFESMRMGVAPVLISDDWILPEGPDWESFLIRVPESGIDQIPVILEASIDQSLEMGLKARKAYEQFFSKEAMPADILFKLENLLSNSGTEWPRRACYVTKSKTIHFYWKLYFSILNGRDKITRSLK